MADKLQLDFNQNLPDGYRGSSIKNNNTKNLESVIFSNTVRPPLEALASDVAGLEYYIENPGLNFLSFVWKKWIESGFQTLLAETTMKSWVYGHVWCAPVVETIWWNKRPYRYPVNIVPFTMSEIQEKKDTIKYKNVTYKKENLLHIVFFRYSGEVFPMGGLYKQLCEYIDTLQEALATGTGQSAVGRLLYMVDRDAARELSDTEYENVIGHFEDHGTTIGGSNIVPDIFKDVKILKSAPNEKLFESTFQYYTSLILRGMRSEFLSSGNTTPGTYGSVRTQKQLMTDYIHNLAGLTCEGLNQFSNAMARWNNVEPVYVNYRKIPTDSDEAQDNLLTLQTLELLMKIQRDYDVPKGILEPTYDRLGYPIGALPEEKPEQKPEDSSVSLNALQDFLSTKKGIIFRHLKNKIETGSKYPVAISLKDNLTKIMKLTGQKQQDLVALIQKLKEEVKSIKSSDYSNLFEKSWSSFIGGLNELRQS